MVVEPYNSGIGSYMFIYTLSLWSNCNTLVLKSLFVIRSRFHQSVTRRSSAGRFTIECPVIEVESQYLLGEEVLYSLTRSPVFHS
jgi:hypothetical protein